MRLEIRRFETALEDVLLHQVVEQNLGTSAYGELARDGPEGAQGLVRRLVDKFAEDAAAVALELARKGNDERHL